MNLHDLTPEALAELTNAGTVRRAAKDLDVAIAWSEGPAGALVAEADDGTRCVLGPGPFDEWECSCTAMYRCRHLVRAVLVWQRDHPVADGATGAEPPPEAGAHGRDDAPGRGPGTGAEPFGDRLRAQGDRLAAGGITARVTTAPRLRVRLLHPVDIGVRYPVGEDPRYARCECGGALCVHVYLAERARELAADALAGSDAALVDNAAGPAEPLDAAPWHAWLDQLLDAGLGASDALIGGAVRLATAWEARGGVHPAAALRGIVTQLEHQRARDAQLSPERTLLLIGEVEARLRALAFEGPAPRAVVAGRPGVELAGESARLLGLGAEWSHVGGWNRLRVHLLDVRTGAVSTLDAEREDTTERLVRPEDLLRERRASSSLSEWAVGTALVPRFRRVGDRLVIGRSRVSVAPSPRLDLDAVAAVVPEGFADVAAQLSGVPGPLGPRRPSDGVLLAPVASVRGVVPDAGASVVRAELTDAAGRRAGLALPWGPRSGDGARRLVGLLSSGSPVAVAGRWRLGEDGLTVEPTAVWTQQGVFLPQVDLALGCEPGGPVRLPAPGADPWTASLDAVAEPLGRLLVLGARRGAASVAPALREAARAVEGRGLRRLSTLADGLADALPVPTARRAAFADACVLLAFAA